MARPLREQFAVATLVLLVPVSAVMVWSAGRAYRQRLRALDEEATRLARAVRAHIDHSEVGSIADLVRYLDGLGRGGAAITIARRGTDPPVLLAQCASRGPDSTMPVPPCRDLTPASGRPVLPPDEPTFELTATTPQEATRQPWTVSVNLPRGQAYGEAVDIYTQTIVISGIATLIVLGLEALFVRRFLRSFVRLERAADRVGGGDLSTPPFEPMPSRELEHVRDAFRDMVDRLRDAREAIARQVEEERRMRREVEMLQQQVIRQERLAAIGLLLSGIAHELNNPLQAISGFAELLQRDKEVRPDVRADLALIQKESARASGIIRNLSRFSRQQNSAPTEVYLTDVVASVVELRQRRLQEHGVRLTIEEAATRPVTSVLTELQQVLLNFVVNAEQALAGIARRDKRVVIRTCDTEHGVLLEVEDNGPGVPTEDESKLFQPFFTTKPVGEGTGLGLSVSYGIIQSFGGTIGYRRGELGGALFSFELPSPIDVPRRAS